MKRSPFSPLASATLAFGSLVVVAFMPAAHGDPIVVTNFSFEDPVLVPGGVSVATPTGWAPYETAGGGTFDVGVENANVNEYTTIDPLAPPAEGSNFMWLNRFNGSGSAGIFQDVGALQPLTVYTLTVAIGSRADRINSPGIISLLNGVDNTGAVLVSGGGLPSTQNTWQDYTISFTTGDTVSGDLLIDLSVLNAGTIQADFDNVRLDASPVPEPSTVAMFLVGGLGVVSMARRRRLLS